MPAHSQLEANANGYYCGVTAVVVGHRFTVRFMSGDRGLAILFATYSWLTWSI